MFYVEKDFLRVLRENFTGYDLSKMKVLYSTILELETEIDFKTLSMNGFINKLSVYSGLSKKNVKNGLKALEDLGIIKLSNVKIIDEEV